MNVKLGDLCRNVVVQEIHRYSWMHTLPTHLIDGLLDHYTSKIGIVDLALLKLISGETWRVSKLSLQNIIIDTSVIKMLVTLKPTLSSISLNRCTFQRNVDLTDLGSFLTGLEINECEGFSLKELKALGSGTFLKLERLRLSSLKPITGRMTKFIMPSLKMLDLYRVTISLILILSEVSGSLSQLRLVQVNGAISQLEESKLIFPNLEYLDLQGSAPSIKFLASIRSWFPSLKRLGLSVLQKKVNVFELEPEEDPLLTLAYDTLSKSGIGLDFVT